MQFSQKETDQALILQMTGEIVMDGVAEIKADLERLAGESPQPALVVDLAGVTFMDSSGVGLLIGLRRICLERGKAMSVGNPSPSIKKLLDMLRLTDFFAVHTTAAPA